MPTLFDLITQLHIDADRVKQARNKRQPHHKRSHQHRPDTCGHGWAPDEAVAVTPDRGPDDYDRADATDTGC